MRVDELSDAISRELSDYTQDVTDGLKADVQAVGKACVARVKDLSPRQTGGYKKGWRLKKAYESATDIRVTVYNKTDGQLTHLLEDGHAKAGGGRVEGRPHIRPAEEAAAEELGKRVKVRVSAK